MLSACLVGDSLLGVSRIVATTPDATWPLPDTLVIRTAAHGCYQLVVDLDGQQISPIASETAAILPAHHADLVHWRCEPVQHLDLPDAISTITELSRSDGKLVAVEVALARTAFALIADPEDIELAPAGDAWRYVHEHGIAVLAAHRDLASDATAERSVTRWDACLERLRRPVRATKRDPQSSLRAYYARMLPYWPVDRERLAPASWIFVDALRAQLTPAEIALVDAEPQPLRRLVLASTLLVGRGVIPPDRDPAVPLLAFLDSGLELSVGHGVLELGHTHGLSEIAWPTRDAIAALR